MGHWEGSPKRKIHSITGLSQKNKKNSNNLALHLKELAKEQQQTKIKVSRRKEI